LEFEFLFLEHFKNADGAIIIFDLSKPQTFEDAKRYHRKLKKYAREKTPFVLLGNKFDLIKNYGVNLDRSEFIQFAKRWGGFYSDCSVWNIKIFEKVILRLYS